MTPLKHDVRITPARPLLAALLAALFVSTAAYAQSPSPDELMVQNFEATRFDSSRYSASLEISRAGAKPRVLSLSGTTKLIDDASANAQLVEFTGPADLKGTMTLTINRRLAEDDLWIYLPSLKRQRRLVSSNRKDAYVGSQFSFGDILGYEPEEWKHKQVGETELDGEPCWIIESVPVSDRIGKDFGYSKRMSWVRKSNYVLKKGTYYDLAGKLLKTVSMDDVKSFASSPDKFQPMRIVAMNDQTQKSSTIRFSAFEADAKVADDEVAPGALEP